MSIKKLLLLFVLCIGITSMNTAGAVDLSQAKTGIRGGIGTDIEGGTAFGLGINKTFLVKKNYSGLEAGLLLFKAHAEETTTESYTYKETTDLTVIGFTVNLLYNYTPDEENMFYLVGTGIGIMSVDWEETSPDDTSLGTPLAGGGSKQSEEASTVGIIFNFGLGKTFGNGFDIRAELPLIIIPGPPGEASGVVPTFTLTAGILF